MKLVKTKVKDRRLVDEKRKHIIDGAIKVFAKKGYHKATVRNIAEASGLGLGSIYDYVKSKEDILYLFYENYMNSFYEKLNIADIKTESDPKKQLIIVYKAHIDVCFELEDQVMLAFTQAMYMKKRYLRDILTRESEIVEKFKEILMDMGLPEREADLTANHLVFSSSFGVLRRWNLKGKHSREEITDFLCENNLKHIMNG
ncbi:MAG: TetR/AcrR family transcriptional regulator [Deltaproteobacteria bacterium]|uniref:TetR/AcrR family transcriptional regulator n=1 Tax=Candidatus Zymogenus saltonus TaxID=2844893 RepID=A0A9D8KFV8_9DELT|nr:TetR/AcrR family transcriptional regulator [Candidatus Zymogenus saltonus]